MAISRVNGLPRSSKFRATNFTKEELDYARANNQFALTGTDPQFPNATGTIADEDYVVFIEAVYTVSGTFVFTDDTGAITGAIVSPYSNDHATMRFDGGVKVTGNIALAKGFYIKVS